jgi:hypothetical protein
VLPHVSQIRALPSREVTSGAATCTTAPGGLYSTGIKKGLAALGTQLGSRVFKARSCIAEAPGDVQAAIVRLQCSVGQADYSCT